MSIFPAHEGEARLPVIVLTGFLGSGKTTLLNRILQHPSMAGTAVVINEIGEVGLDQHFLDEADTDVVMLSNGCLCCRVMEDLEDTVSNIYSRRTQGDLPAFERLIIETTGLADPGPVLEGFLSNPMLSRCFRVAGVVTTVDALHCEGQLDKYYESVRQVAVADRLLLTKLDLVDTATRTNLVHRLHSLNAAAEISDAESALQDPSALFQGMPMERPTKWTTKSPEAPAAGLRSAMDHGRDHPHDTRVATFTVVLEDPVDWGPFSDWLRRLRVESGDRLLRLKGILNVRGEARPIAIHGVHHVLHPPAALKTWPWEDRHSRLVFVTSDLSRGAVVEGLHRALGIGSHPMTTSAIEAVRSKDDQG
jgi:G3E family GTPase